MSDPLANNVLLKIEDLCIDYPIALGTVRAVRGVSVEVHAGETLGIVGESGSGKSTLGLAILRLVRAPGRITAGRVLFNGKDLASLPEDQMRQVRGKDIAMVFQNPLTSLNPLMRIDKHFLEALKTHKPELKKPAALKLIREILTDLGIEESRMGAYPHQLSGGMRQRIMIGLGLILRPKLVICDEPTTALDVIVEAGFIDLLKRLQKEFALTIVVITHNLGLVAELADRIAVMYAGQIVENAPAAAVFHEPLHPYTQGLIACVPNIDLDQEKLTTMEGSPPGLVNPPPGCAFAPRCPLVMGRCRNQEPPLAEHRPGHFAACWRIGHE
ncbi:MAG: ABC transporter ATP-binding protein [Spirochaetales bacterium]